MSSTVSPPRIPTDLATSLRTFLLEELHNKPLLKQLLEGSNEQKVNRAVALADLLCQTVLQYTITLASTDDLAFLESLPVEALEQLKELAELLGYERMQSFFIRKVFLLRDSVHIGLSA